MMAILDVNGLQCTAPVPASATRDDLNYMAPDDGKDCPTWHAK